MAVDFGGECSIVLDSSAVINLNATERATEILAAFSNKMKVTEMVFDELEQGEMYGYDDGSKLRILLDKEFVELVRLSGEQLLIYRGLVAGNAGQSLADGEASTIAYAVVHDAVAVIDDRKASKLCARQFTNLRVLTTIELLLHKIVQSHLGHQDWEEAIYLALRAAKMYVPPELVSTVVSLIGIAKAADCTSLPRHARMNP